jgi:hypothetical protein
MTNFIIDLAFIKQSTYILKTAEEPVCTGDLATEIIMGKLATRHFS